MKVYKEKEIKNPLYVTRLDNGVELLVYDGYAEGSDGKIYYPVIEEINGDEVEVVGWVRKNSFAGQNVGRSIVNS